MTTELSTKAISKLIQHAAQNIRDDHWYKLAQIELQALLDRITELEAQIDYMVGGL